MTGAPRRSGRRTGCPDTVSAADAPLIDSDVVGIDQVGAHDRRDDLDLVAEALGEARPQRPVGEPAGEDGGLARATLTTEDAAGDLPGGVHALLDVDREREEVDALAGLATCTTVLRMVVSPTRTSTAPSAWGASLPVSRVISRPAALMGPLTRIASMRNALLSRPLRAIRARRGGSQLSPSGCSSTPTPREVERHPGGGD